MTTDEVLAVSLGNVRAIRDWTNEKVDRIYQDGFASRNVFDTTLESLMKLNSHFAWDGVKFSAYGITVTPHYSNGMLDGFIFDGTATAGISFKISEYDIHLPSGVYKLLGEEHYLDNNRCMILRFGKNGSNSYTYKYVLSEPFAVSNEDSIHAYVWTYTGRTWNNELVKPMLTTDLSATYEDFTPYAKSNVELTKVNGLILNRVNIGSKVISAGSNIHLHSIPVEKGLYAIQIAGRINDGVTNPSDPAVNMLLGVSDSETFAETSDAKVAHSAFLPRTYSTYTLTSIIECSTGYLSIGCYSRVALTFANVYVTLVRLA